MGATLEFTRVKAKSFTGAIRELHDRPMSDDPYSGDFNTCHDYEDKSRKFEDVGEFCDWVEEEGEKREAYFYKLDEDRWLIGAWCAC